MMHLYSARDPIPPRPVASVGDLLCQRMRGWYWIICANPSRGHEIPAALAPLAVRFRRGTSSDVIRRRAIRPARGYRGAVRCLPSWAINLRTGAPGWALFPTLYRSSLRSNGPIAPDTRSWIWPATPTMLRPIAPAHFRF